MSVDNAITRMLFEAPDLDARELEVLAQIGALKKSLRFQLHEPRRWSGALRRMAFARNIQGSNSIEGYDAALDDAAAVALGEEPLDASTETRLALEGYRNAMTYVLQIVQEPEVTVSEDLVKSLHFMMTNYDLKNRPGRWRAGQIFVRDERSGDIVHEGVEIERVPQLMEVLIAAMNDMSGSAIVRAAMAHLNLVMIHPFRDGNGRMARCLQSLVLAADGTLAPVFMSVEEHLGRNTQDYYDVLAEVGGGSWQPSRDARPWLRFMLTAHLKQAQTLQRRVKASEQVWSELEILTREHHVAERTISALFDAVFGYRMRRATYMAALKDAGEEVSEQTATRDFKALVDAGLLTPYGDKRGRYYTGSEALIGIRERAREMREPKDRSDPFA
jgi:Fic family protein